MHRGKLKFPHKKLIVNYNYRRTIQILDLHATIAVYAKLKVGIMPTIQKIHVRYVNKKKLNDLLKSLFKADTYEFEVPTPKTPCFGRAESWMSQENEADKTVILTVPRKLFKRKSSVSMIGIYFSHRQED